jgi:hypothetical protein
MSEDRRKARALKIWSAHNLLRQRVGVVGPEEVHIATLSTISEMKGLWQALLDRGLISEAQRQDYLDRGADALVAQCEAKAAQIEVVG